MATVVVPVVVSDRLRHAPDGFQIGRSDRTGQAICEQADGFDDRIARIDRGKAACLRTAVIVNILQLEDVEQFADPVPNPAGEISPSAMASLIS